MKLPTQDALASWLARLVQIPSVAPAYAGPHSGEVGEGRIAAALAEWFGALGGEVHVHEALPGRPNVYGLWRGESGRLLAVDVHTDTVGVEHMTADPFSGQSAQGRVYGRGAVDTKASLGVILALLEAMQTQGVTPPDSLLIAATADEEVGATGAPNFAHWLRQQARHVDQLLVAEPTLCRPIHGHKGVVRQRFEVRGQAAHSSQPHLGRNAITAAARIVEAMEAERRRIQRIDSPLGAPVLSVTLIEGGDGINIVPDRCRVSIDRRIVPGESAATVAASLRGLAEDACPLPVVCEDLLVIDAFYQSPDTAWVRQLAEWSRQTPTVAPYGTNAWAYPDVADECVVIGPGSIDQAHGAEEWVSLAELEKLATIYARWWGITPSSSR
ncbi:MAG: M20/M25/M40 family metallo-hydrolase [Caldilineaceae bacterium]|nr:M20/M25/M40 family metallo-hydrolase [Caldilineaceae bacterium]